jgi:hypothetical protein
MKSLITQQWKLIKTKVSTVEIWNSMSTIHYKDINQIKLN